VVTSLTRSASESPSLLTSVSTGGQLLSLPASAQWSVCILLVMEWSVVALCAFRMHIVLVLSTFEVRCQLRTCWFALLCASLAAQLARLCLLYIIRMQFLVSCSVVVFWVSACGVRLACAAPPVRLYSRCPA
jgi:hypothetical protein